MRLERSAKIPKKFRKTEKFWVFLNETPTPPISNFFEIFFGQKTPNFQVYFQKETPSQSENSKKSYVDLKNPENPPKGDSPKDPPKGDPFGNKGWDKIFEF